MVRQKKEPEVGTEPVFPLDVCVNSESRPFVNLLGYVDEVLQFCRI